jgi:hypothetical protein
MDTGRLLLAFLAFGAACTTLWAWMLANSGANATGRSVSPDQAMMGMRHDFPDLRPAPRP